VSGPNFRFQHQATVAQDLFKQVRTTARDAARANDAGTLGVDGWIQTMHKLINFGIGAYADSVQALLAGPWWLEPPFGEPPTSEPITVSAQDYARGITIVEPFTRVGLPRVQIPNQLIQFEPDVLPARQTDIRIKLKDYRYLGANYTGTICLQGLDAQPGVPPEEPITRTVGL
jgi:hypothetical protein